MRTCLLAVGFSCIFGGCLSLTAGYDQPDGEIMAYLQWLGGIALIAVSGLLKRLDSISHNLTRGGGGSRLAQRGNGARIPASAGRESQNERPE